MSRMLRDRVGRMLTAVPAALLIVAAAVQVAPAKPDEPGSGGQKGPSAGAIAEATATASASGQGSTATATATCPSRTKVAGGGFDAPYSTEVVGVVYESVRVGRKAWRASVQLLDPGQPTELTLTAYAYCRPHLPSARKRSATEPTTGETQLGPTLVAGCGRGEVALAGGFTMPPPLVDSLVRSLYFDSLRSNSDGWTTRVVTGPAGTSMVTSEAYCSQRGLAPVATSAASAPNSRDFSASVAVAGCPAGLSPAAGGFAQPDSGLMSFFIVYESRRVSDSWRVSGVHSGNDPAITLGSTAYCA